MHLQSSRVSPHRHQKKRKEKTQDTKMSCSQTSPVCTGASQLCQVSGKHVTQSVLCRTAINPGYPPHTDKQIASHVWHKEEVQGSPSAPFQESGSPDRPVPAQSCEGVERWDRREGGGYGWGTLSQSPCSVLR